MQMVQQAGNPVAPVRERGLKSLYSEAVSLHCRRSREGAWIEIQTVTSFQSLPGGRSREGAWIEIAKKQAALQRQNVAPVRERGLKYNIASNVSARIKRSLP